MLTPATLATLAAIIAVGRSVSPVECLDEAMGLYYAAEAYLLDVKKSTTTSNAITVRYVYDAKGKAPKRKRKRKC